ncbi:beta strand repeat-containing protein, partial [Marilutibacter aestuarii]
MSESSAGKRSKVPWRQSCLAAFLFLLGTPLAHAQADIGVTKTDGATTYVPGGVSVYTIVVTNNGPNATTFVSIEDPEPSQTSFSWTCASSGGVACPSASGSGEILEETGAFPVGGVLTYTVTATTQSTRTGPLVNTVFVANTSSSDPVSANNFASDTNVVEPQADIVVTKDDGSATYVPGDDVVYTIVVTNNGPSDAVNVRVQDPEPTAPVAATFTGWTCTATNGATCPATSGTGGLDETAPTLPNGGVLTYTVTATTPPDATDNLSNLVLVTADSPDPDIANNAVEDVDTAEPSADLSIAKSLADPNPAVPGGPVTWTLEVSNAGPSTAPLTGTDTIPSSVTNLVLGGPDASACSIAGQVLTCNSTGLVPGDTATVTVTGDLEVTATGTLDNTAEVAATGGVTDPDASNNSATSSTPIVESVSSTTKTAAPASGTPVAVGDVLTYTLTTTISDAPATAEILLVDNLDFGLTLVGGSLPAGCQAVGQLVTCTVPVGTPVGDAVFSYQATVNDSALGFVSNSVVSDSGDCLSCTTSHPVKRQVSIIKLWVDAIAGDAVDLTLSGDPADVLDIVDGSSTAPLAATPATANVVAGATVDFAEAFTTGSPGNYTTEYLCAESPGGATIASGTGASGSFTMPAGSEVACEFINRREPVQLSVAKQWASALPGDTADLSTSGFTNNVSFTSTADSTGNNVSIGTPVSVYPGDSGSIDEILGNPDNYTASLACSGNAQPLAGNTLTIDPADTAIDCTWTNERKAVNLVIQKTWLNAAIGEAVQVTATGSATSPIALDSVADTSTETDNAQFQVFSGETLTLAETFAVAANGANYDQALACTGNTQALSGNALTVDPADTTITCTFTNTRLSATLQLAKAWGPGALTGDTAQIGATSGLVNNTSPFSTPAPLPEDSGAAVTVYAGEQASLPAETMSVGNLDNYGVTLSCNGGALSGSDGKSVNALDIQPSDAGTNIVCTYTNDRFPTTLTLQKVWLNAIAGDSVEIAADRPGGGLGSANVSSSATGGASQTDTGATVDIYAGDVIQMLESFGNGTSNNYDIDIACTNTSGFVPGGSGVGGTLTVAPADGPVTCTWTNDRKSAQLIVQKVWAGPSPGATVDIPASTGFTNNTPAFSSDFPTTTQVGPVEVFVTEVGALGAESFSVGDPGDFDSSLACDGSDQNLANGLGINVADANNTITCTYSNTFVQRPELTVDKSSASTVTQAGDVVTYDITVTNTGNVPLDDVAVSDPLPGLVLGTCTPALPADLAVGAVITCSATYQVTQADIDRNGASDGSDDDTISNTATAAGTTDGGAPVTDDGSTDVPLPAQEFTADFTKDGVLVDDVDGSGRGSAGDTIGYTFTVTNTGNSTIASVTISDPRLPGLSCDPSGPILPGETVTFGVSPPADVNCTGATYLITQADIDNQGDDSAQGRDVDIDNTATGSFVGPNGGSTSLDATDQVPIDLAQPLIDIQKTANPTAVDNAGDVVTYTFVVTNPGNVTIEDVTIVDGLPGLGPITCGADSLPTDLAPGAQLTCTAQYTVTQADIDAGSDIVNTAEAAGSYNGDPVDDDDQEIVDVNPGPGQAEIFKTADKTVVTTVGEIVTYTFTVENAGAQTLLNLQVTDDTLLGAGLACDTIPDLAPGASATFDCTGNTYAVQQSDIDDQGNPVVESGELVNTVTAQAEYIDNGSTVVGTDSDSWTVDLPPRGPQMEVVKSSDVASVSGPGSLVTYTFLVRNLGNVTLLDLEVSDPLLTGLACDPIATLAPGDSATFTCTGNVYTVTQADIDSGSTDFEPGDNQIDNRATVTAGVPGGTSLQASDENEVNLPVHQPSISIDKSADVATVTAIGTIDYGFEVTNTGNVTVNDVDVSDPTLGLACPTWPSLAPGESVTFGGTGADVVCTGTTREVDQAILDAGGSLDNTASVAGQTVSDGPVGASDLLQLPIDQNPGLAFGKQADVSIVNNPGEVITYAITGTNTGNVTLQDVDVADPLVAGTLVCTPPTPIAALAPGEGFTCSGTYAATQSDFDTQGGGDGFIENQASASWSGGSADASANVEVAPQRQSLDLNKTAGTPTIDQGLDASVTDAGDTIPYTFVVENTGNVTLSAIAITDPNLDAPAVCDKADIPATSPPDSVTTCTGVHTITQAEMDVGQVTNSATAQGTPPGSSRISSLPDTTITTLVRDAAIELTKTAAAPTQNLGALPTVTDAGDQVTYTFSVQNTGNVTLRQVDVADALMPGTNLVCTPTQLPPGATAACGSATYTLAQADIDAGIVTNDATATAIDPNDAPVSDDDAVDVPLDAIPGISLAKSAAPATVSTLGETVTYSFLVSNAGNVTLDTLVITETAFSGTGAVSAISCPSTTLAPGASTTCTASYDVTQGDLDAGEITNAATATAGTPGGPDVTSEPSSAVVTVDEDASLVLVKTATPTTVSAVGEPVTYSFEVSNAGNVTIDTLSITETAFSGSGPA